MMLPTVLSPPVSLLESLPQKLSPPKPERAVMLLLMLAAIPFAAFVMALAILSAAAPATILLALIALVETVLIPLAVALVIVLVAAEVAGLERRNLKMLPSFRLQVDHKDRGMLTFASGLLTPCTPLGKLEFGFVLLGDMMVDSLRKSLMLFAKVTSFE